MSLRRRNETENENDESTHLLADDRDEDANKTHCWSHKAPARVNATPFWKVKYPKSVFFIISNEFCERFSHYGMKAVLSLYLTSALNYDTDTATVIYHLFVMLCYFTPVFGGIIADSFLGKFKTIVYLSLIYAVGNVVLATAAIPTIPLPHREISLLGLLFIATGTGGIKPCVSSFGGDQFVLPEQSLQLQKFFSLYYFSINAGSMISTIITPSLRNDVKCFSQQSCFPLAFGVPSILMVISIVILLAGKHTYKMKTPDENIIVIFIDCVWRGIMNKFRGVNCTDKKHWIECADDKYSKQQIADIKAVLNVLKLFTPLPIFWALFDQQGSKWTFQATHMDGRIFGYTILPDQMQVLNPLLILIFIPVFELFIYPILKTVGVKRPLQKLVIGGSLAAVAFACSAIVQSHVEKSLAPTPDAGTSNLRIFNTLNCPITLDPPIENGTVIAPLSAIEMIRLPVNGSRSFDVNFRLDDSCSLQPESISKNFKAFSEIDTSYFIGQESGSLWLSQPTLDKLIKDNDGAVKIRFFYGSTSSQPVSVNMKSSSNQDTLLSENISPNTASDDFLLVKPGRYDLVIDSKVVLADIVLNPGEIDTIVIQNLSNDEIHAKIFNLAPPNKVHMLWQLPQISIITAGEVMFSITGFEFSFTQAPKSMKSVVSSSWLLTVAFGNLLVAMISELRFFESQVYEFTLFAVLMVIDVFLLIILCVRYKYVTYDEDDGSDTLASTVSVDEITSKTKHQVSNS